MNLVRKWAVRLMICVAIPLLLTSCFVIEENYSFNADGSGQMQFVIDMSQLASIFPEGMDRDSMGLGQIGEAFEEMESSVADLPGISNARTIADEENFRFGVSYNFKDVASLNEALGVLLSGGGGSTGETYISQDGRFYSREATEGTNILVEGLKSELGEDEEMAFIFSSMKYKVNMQVPKPIRTIYSESEFEQSDDKQISFEYNMEKLSQQPSLLNMTVVTK